MAAAEISDNYSGRVLQRNAFRTRLGRTRTTGSAISSVLSGLRALPPRPARLVAPLTPTLPAAVPPAAPRAAS